MRFLLSLLIALFLLAAAMGQDFKPQPGQTVLRLSIEGKGTVSILLYTREAPKTTAHIIRLAKDGFYDGQRFHLAVKTPRPYRVQIGDPGSKTKSLDDPSMGSGGSGMRIPYEDSGQSHERGAVGLSTPQQDRNAGDSQFYILLAPQKFLDGSYTVFGRVVQGMDVVERVERGDRVTSAKIVTG